MKKPGSRVEANRVPIRTVDGACRIPRGVRDLRLRSKSRYHYERQRSLRPQFLQYSSVPKFNPGTMHSVGFGRRPLLGIDYDMTLP
jgi:hypothetical protein